MLRGREIQAIAGKEKVADTQIEKDYIITWLLWGISQIHLLRSNLIFKGGTVLRKAYFPDYRYSEDLDFTLSDSDLMDPQIIAAFSQSLELVEEESGIQLKLSEPDKHESGSITFYIYFVGPLGGKMENRSVKVDLTRGEKVLFEPLNLPIFKSYLDLPVEDYFLRCYPLEEIMVEKMVALMGRTQPRDLYDIWYLIKENTVELDFLKIEFKEKALHKGHKPENFLAVWSRKTSSLKASGTSTLRTKLPNSLNLTAFAGC